ncbi:hypothetical protein V2J09_011395 [Rumex salicifolius]
MGVMARGALSPPLVGDDDARLGSSLNEWDTSFRSSRIKSTQVKERFSFKTWKGKSASKKVVFREDKKDASPPSTALVIYDPSFNVVGVSGASETQMKMAEDINLAKDVKKSKGLKSKDQGKWLPKKSSFEKQKVGVSVAESSESMREGCSGACPSESKRLSIVKPRRHGSVALLCSTLKNFNDAQKAAVREMGFGHLFSWDVDSLPYILCDWLVGKFNSASSSIRCGNGLLDIPINDLIVEQHLGLPRGRYQCDTSRVNFVQVKSWRARYPENKAVLYYDKVNLFGDEPERKIPIISGYSSELYKFKHNQHSSCGFDRGFVREAHGGPFYKFIRHQADLARIIAEYIRPFYQHIRTAPKDVQDFNTY